MYIKNELQRSNLQYNDFGFYMTSQDSPLPPWRASRQIMAIQHKLCTSHKTHLILNFTEIDEVSVNIFHNDNEST